MCTIILKFTELHVLDGWSECLVIHGMNRWKEEAMPPRNRRWTRGWHNLQRTGWVTRPLSPQNHPRWEATSPSLQVVYGKPAPHVRSLKVYCKCTEWLIIVFGDQAHWNQQRRQKTSFRVSSQVTFIFSGFQIYIQYNYCDDICGDFML